MRILQVIDSLEAGGAERMAVNYANSLEKKIQFSGIVVTRKEGDLFNELKPNVHYFFLNKKSKLQVTSFYKLYKIIKSNKINFLHAHSTSFFTAVIVKIFIPNLKLIWHDHYGKSEFLENRKSLILKLSSFFFNGIISVNEQLKNWAKINLYCKNVIYLENFTLFQEEINEKITQLYGEEGKRILCLANLRHQKNHSLLLKIAEKTKISHPDWTFHLVGKDFNDNYSKDLRANINNLELRNNVFIYGSKNDITNIIKQANIGILTSISEGLPVALLEYGINKLPVVVTNVGQISSVINNSKNGFLTNINEQEFYLSLVKLIDNKNLMNNFGESLYETIIENYSEKAVVNQYLNWLENKL